MNDQARRTQRVALKHSALGLWHSFGLWPSLLRHSRHASWRLALSLLLAACCALGCGPPGRGPRQAGDQAQYEKTYAGLRAELAKYPPRQVVLGEGDLLTGIPGEGPLTLGEIDEWLRRPWNQTPLEIGLPLGLEEAAGSVMIPDDNRLTREKIELGRQLFFDRRLSDPETRLACADCHHPVHHYGFSSHNLDLAVGPARSVPAIYNRIFGSRQYADGRAASLEDQAVQPLVSPAEMNTTVEAALVRLAAIPGYRDQFQAIFGEVSPQALAQALASFERAIVSGRSAYDIDVALRELPADAPIDRVEELRRWSAERPYSPAARRGEELFFSERVGCASCHAGPNFSDEEYHNIGVGQDAKSPDLGRFLVTGVEADRGAFRTPTLRNIVRTGPYMHRGQLQILREVIDWYDQGGGEHPQRDPRIRPLHLSEREKRDLVAFLESLTGDLPPITTGRLPE
jgi:cytochrome c peroxidase